MKTNRAKLIVLGVFALTLCAGAVSGFLAARVPRGGGVPVVAPAGNGSLADELELTPEQQKDMQAIWEGVRDLSDESYKNSKRLQERRDEEVRALVPADKMPEYNGILKKCQDENARLDGQRQAAFAKAVKRTKEMLSPAQQKKYDEILAKRLGAENAGSHDPVGEAAETTRPSQPSS